MADMLAKHDIPEVNPMRSSLPPYLKIVLHEERDRAAAYTRSFYYNPVTMPASSSNRAYSAETGDAGSDGELFPHQNNPNDEDNVTH